MCDIVWCFVPSFFLVKPKHIFTDQPTQKAPFTIQNLGETSEPPIYRCKKHTQPVSFPLHSHSFPIQCWLYQLYLYFSSLKHIKPHFWGVGSTQALKLFKKTWPVPFYSHSWTRNFLVPFYIFHWTQCFSHPFFNKIHKDLDLGRTECRCVCVCTVISRLSCGCGAAARSTLARPPQKPRWRCDDANVMGKNLGIWYKVVPQFVR